MLGFSIIDNRPSPESGRKEFIQKYSFVPDGTRFRCKPIFPALKRWAIIAGEMGTAALSSDCSSALRAPECNKERRFLTAGAIWKSPFLDSGGHRPPLQGIDNSQVWIGPAGVSSLQ